MRSKHIRLHVQDVLNQFRGAIVNIFEGPI